MNRITVGGNPINGHLGGVKYPNFDKRMTPNIDIMLKSSMFSPLDNTY